MSTKRNRIVMERNLVGRIEDVWALWTTKEGIESWWGPDGFAVTVRKIDLRAGGELHYGMSAIEPDKIAFMKRAGMPITTECTARYTEVAAPTRLRYIHLANFVPGVEPYDVDTHIDLEAAPDGVRMILSFDPMHDEVWTQRAVAGWTNELEKLARRLQS